MSASTYIIKMSKLSFAIATVFCISLWLTWPAQAQLPVLKGGSLQGPGQPSPEQLAQSRRLRQIEDAGMAFLKQQKWSAAIAKFREALAVEKYDGLAYYGLAQAYTGKGQPAEAVANYRFLYAAHVDEQGLTYSMGVREPEAHMNFAIALARVGQAEEAVAVYHEGLKLLNPGGSGAEPLPLMLTFSIGNPQLGQFSNYTPAKLEAAARLALAIETTDQKEELEQLHQAITLQPNWALAHFYLGFAQRHSNPKAMDAEFDKALALSLGGTEMSEVVAEIRKKGFVAKPKWPTDPNNIRNQKPTNLSDSDGFGVGH